MTVNLSLNRQSKNNNFINFENQKCPPKPKQSFGSMAGLITNALIASDKSPMIGVSIIDLLSMIGPRTIVDATRNGFAATETFLRESAGLIINCLIPSFVVYGVAKLLEKPFMGAKNAEFEPSKFWANQKSNELLTNAWLSTKDVPDKTKRMETFVSKVLDNVEGLAGQNDWRKLKDLPNKKEIYKNLSSAILNNDKQLLEQTTNTLIQSLEASRNIRLINKTPFTQASNIKELSIDTGLKSLVRDMKDLGGAFVKMSDDAIPAFSKKLTKLINGKSFIGLAVVIAAGASFQFFNRLLTKYRTGSDDFVGEKDYLKRIKARHAHNKQELCEKEKSKLNFHKVIGTLGMALLAILSFGKRPTLNMFQFNGMFPTLNQCRAISAVTYSGRIISSKNDNELKETALRDTCTFINLYYLGDYVSKAFATMKEKISGNKGELLNETCKLKENANGFEKFWHWFKHTELKGFEELKNNPSIKRNRAFAQASGLLYSCIVLGLLVPMYNKHRTNKKAIDKQRMQVMASDLKNATDMDTNKLYTSFLENASKLA